MLDLVKKYIGKECIIYTINTQLTGTIKEVADGWLSVDTGTDTDVVNIDYVIRIRQYPKGKNGKKRSLVLD